MKFFDDKSKNVNWYNRNYFYLGTIILITLNIFIFALGGSGWSNQLLDISTVSWYDTLNFNNLVSSILNCVEHANWAHVLLNMACFSICGIYFERKSGTFNFLLLAIAVTILVAGMTSGAYLAAHWHGWSGVLYAFYAIVYVDYFFSFSKQKRNKTNIILGAIICTIIYVFMCAERVGYMIQFYPYPHDLTNNLGHYSAFLVGIIVGLIINLSQVKILKQSTRITQDKQPLSKKLKIAYTCVLVGIIILVSSCAVTTGIAITRTDMKYSITFDCNYDEFDYVMERQFPKDRSNNSCYSLKYEWETHFASELDGYGYEIFLDKYCVKQLTREDSTKYSIGDTYLWYYYDNTMPLTMSANQTFYVKLFKVYSIEFVDFLEYTNSWSMYEWQDKTLFTPSEFLVNKFFVKENENTKFKIEGLKYSANMIKLFANGTELIMDSDGYYEINNISNDIQITYQIIENL